MREPSREAREAAEAVTGSVSRWYYAKPARRVNMDTPRDTIARALDDFAETVTQERDALRRRVGELEAALLSIRSCFDHFGEWSANAAPMAVCDMPALIDAAVERDSDALAELVTDNERDHWKARAEAAEKALDEIARAHLPFDLSKSDADQLDEFTSIAHKMRGIAQEARRARGEG